MMVFYRLATLLAAFAATSISAQTHVRVSATARRQIDSAVKSLVPLGAPGAAEAAGFRPTFGWIPTMGEHWVSRGKMLSGRQTNRAAPSQLMFSKIGGRDSLVGAAYAYITAIGDTVRPVLFDGGPAWHEHRDLAPEGLTLVMLHVWFVPSPDGPFAGTNPNLPFWAVGLAAPNAARMSEPAFKSLVYRASLGLAEVADSSAILAELERRPAIRASLAAHRDTIRTLIPQFLAAQKARDSKRWSRVAEQAAKQWDAMQATYIRSEPTADGRARIEQYFAMLLGHHVH